MESKDIAARIAHELGTAARREAPVSLHPPPQVADHELVRRIGEGSYGEVWLARSITGQWRAVKAVARDRFTSDRPFEREYRGVVQFEPISRSHPSLVQVLHVGRDDSAGAFYYVMELADEALPSAEGKGANNRGTGVEPEMCPAPDFDPATYRPRTLATDLRARGRIPVAEAVALGLDLTGALGHIHRSGLVHRDVKPSNVIFVRGRAKLADLGLVTRTQEARSFVGTEGFIPPEGPGSVQADLFALGRLLYEAVTGKDRCEFPELPADLDAWPDRAEFVEFNEILTRLCAPGLAQRYRNAAEVAGDLNLILAGHSVRRANDIERRLRVATRTVGVALGVLALTAGVLWLQAIARSRAEIRAEHEMTLRERAEAAERGSREQLYAALLEQARAHRLSREMGQRVRTLEAIRRAAELANTPELRTEAVAALGKPDLQPVGEILFDLEERPSFDPTFERFAVTRGDGPVAIHATSDRRLLATLPAVLQRPAHVMRWSDDGRFLAIKRDHVTSGARSDVEVWDLTTVRRVLHLEDRMTYDAMAFRPRTTHFMTAEEGRATLWDLSEGSAVREFAIDLLPFRLEFAPDGERFAVVNRNPTGVQVRVCDIHTGAAAYLFQGEPVYTVRWHPSGRLLALLERSGEVRLAELGTGKSTLMGRHKASVVEGAFVQNGDYLITGGWEAELICWDVRMREAAFTIGLNSWRPAVHRDGRRCAVYLRDRVRFYNIEPPDCLQELEGLADLRNLGGSYSGNGRWLAVGRNNGFAVWDLENPGPCAEVTNDYSSVLFNPTDTEIFAYKDRSMTRWRIESGPPRAAPLLVPQVVWTSSKFCSASLRGNDLILTGTDGIRFLDLSHPADDPVGHRETAEGWSAVSQDGRWLAARDQWSPVLRMYQLPGLGLATRLTNRSDVWSFTFSPNGAELAVGTRTGLEMYDTRNWRRVRELAAPGERQSRIIYAPDGTTLWYTSDGRTSALRDARTLRELLPLPSNMLPLALSPDGHHLAVSVDARRVQVWDLPRVRTRLHELGLDWQAGSKGVH